MKSKSFEEFYNKAMIIAKIIKENYRENAINTKLVENFTDITECFTLGELPQIIKQELMSNSKTLQISFGNLVSRSCSTFSLNTTLIFNIAHSEKNCYNIRRIFGV